MSEPKSEAINALYWRAEILEVMFWIRGEGFPEDVTPPLLERFLGVDASIIAAHLGRLADEGYVVRRSGRFTLGPRGLEEGEHIFAAEFADLTRPVEGDCGPECWCHISDYETTACTAERGTHR